jgi:redox-sensitive bicupin YhaK (pirin superfamily)
METTIIHKAAERGHANHGWLDAHHTFSFANYHNPAAMHFGVLRVLNDDIIAGGGGFGTHPHDNMEIITIPLKGALAHKDSMGNTEVIRAGDVQVMSAGTGVRHSEFNASDTEAVNLLQIWLFPNKRNVSPRYGQISLDTSQRHNRLQQILSPNPGDEGVWIHQNAWFHMANLDKDVTLSYELKNESNGVYAFIIKGDVRINGQGLHTRDGIGISGTRTLSIHADTEAEILLMEVPMEM